ncbi:MAG: hypothetical protein R2755_31200 [Acidimicrobiales bacterium]
MPPPLATAADAAVAARLVANTRLANVTGLPAISVPVPDRTLPVGIQVEARTDDVAFIVAAALEAALRRAGGPRWRAGWARRRDHDRHAGRYGHRGHLHRPGHRRRRGGEGLVVA